MLRPPSVVSSLLPLLVGSLVFASPALAQPRVVDEGTFVFVKGGAPVRTENFRITRTGAAITATAAVTAGTQQITTLLSTDTLGTPAQFKLQVKEKGATVVDLKAMAGGGRLTSLASSQTGDESMREYPLTPGRSVVMEPGIAHLLYFTVLGKSPGTIHIIEPRSTRTLNATLSATGLEPLEIAGKSVTGTHYTLAIGPTRYEFWIDARGRLLRVDAGDGLTATRDDLPR